MKRTLCLLVLLLLSLAACGPSAQSVPLYDLVEDPQRYEGQEVTVLGFYYEKDDRHILTAGVRTDDGFQNPVPLGEAIWVEGMPQEVVRRLNFAAGATYGMVQVGGVFETGRFGPEGAYPSRLQVTDPAAVVALEAAQLEEEWVPQDLEVPGAVPLAELVRNAEQFSGQTVTLVAYYYWTPQTWVLAEGIRSLDGVHNAVPIGQQVWVEGFPPEVSWELHVLENNVHGLVKVVGRFETRGGYGAGGAYPYRVVVQSAEALRR